jgi:hypothetical protein
VRRPEAGRERARVGRFTTFRTHRTHEMIQTFQAA